MKCLSCLIELWSVIVRCSNGCATSEDMLWKLDALQSFILDLHWPDEVFAEHLSHRLKLMSADMIEAAAKRSPSQISVHSRVCFDFNEFPPR